MNAPLELRFLGVGDSESLLHYNTNALVTINARRMLIDCGWTAKRAIHDLGLSIADIDAIYVSHIHGDHVFGLERFGFETRYVLGGRKIQLIAKPAILELLWNECLKGCMGYSSDGENRLEDFFEVTPIQGNAFLWGEQTFEVFPTTHTVGKPSFGLRLPGRFTFTSDTNVIPDLADIVEDDRFVFHDACLVRRTHPAHATLEEMRESYPVSLLSRLYLMHYEDEALRVRPSIDGFGGVVTQGQVFQW